MANLKKFIHVTYEKKEQACNALRAAESKYYSSVKALAQNLNRVEGTSVFFAASYDSVRDHLIRKFLLEQEGALPDGCHVN